MYEVPQPPSGQPQVSSQPQPPAGQPQPLPTKRRRWPWIVGIIAALVVLALGALVAVVLLVNNSPAKAVSQQYYDAIKNQDYAAAYSHLDPTLKLTVQGQTQQISESLFTQVAQAYDQEKGKVTDYSITGVSLNSSSSTGNTADVTVSVTRSGKSYDVHLQLQQQGNDWKIISFDNL